MYTVLVVGYQKNYLVVLEDLFCAEGYEVITKSPADRADKWVATRPGTDTTLVLSIAHALILENLIDADFVERYCEGFNDRVGPRRLARTVHVHERPDPRTLVDPVDPKAREAGQRLQVLLAREHLGLESRRFDPP